jgi:glucosylceramidase
MKRKSRQGRRLILAAAAALAVTSAAAVSAAAPAGAVSSEPVAVTVDAGQRDQVIDGFGFSEAFREPVISSLPTAERQQIGADLFSTTVGAGMSIVRFGLGGPTDPGDPINGPGDYQDQVWLGTLAEEFGVRQFYADAWTAPARFKTNDSLDEGGYLCGAPGETCASGDARPGYAAYLAGQAKGFADNGIPIEAVDFVNEAEIGPAYASMYMTPAQAANFIPYLGRALRTAHLPTKVACCDAEGWLDQPASGGTGTPAFDGGQAYTQAVLADPAAARYVSLITSHGYTSPPSVPLTGRRPVWQSEWADQGAWDASWDDATTGDGFAWAQNILGGLTRGGVSGFFYWWGASNSAANSDLIKVNGSAISLSGRYWAFAAFGRYLRPGAVRLGTTTSDGDLEVSAFRNGDGSVVTEILNPGTAAVPVSLRGVPGEGSVPGEDGVSAEGGVPGEDRAAGHGTTAYVTNGSDRLTPEGGPLSVPARSLLTVVTKG